MPAMPGRLALWFCLSAVCAIPLHVACAEAQTVRLTSGELSALIAPSTLETTLSSSLAGTLQLSQPTTATQVLNLQQAATSASWELPEHALSVSMELTSQALEIRLLSSREGKFTWPVLQAQPPVEALALPLAEGVYVPVHDQQAFSYLLERGAMDTTADFSMPFWGVHTSRAAFTCILTNQFNNEITFSRDASASAHAMRLTHAFTRNNTPKQYGLRIEASASTSPVEAAQRYRAWLISQGQFVTMSEKIRKTPEAAMLPGAAHVYLWGETLLDARNIKDIKALCRALVAAGGKSSASTPASAPAAVRIWTLLPASARDAADKLAKSTWKEKYLQIALLEGLCSVLERPDLAGSADDSLTSQQLWKANAEFLRAAFPGQIADYNSWGNGYSVPMMDALSQAGFDRLWVGLGSQAGMLRHAPAVKRARELGYLVGPYDSYHSIHSPQLKSDATWETAQFDQKLFETGPVVRADGTKFAGFKKKGYRLSSTAAWPYVQKRVSALMSAVPCNSWFMDCDAFGELNDDYSPLHPTTQQEDMQARLLRMAWIRDTFGAVVGSEGGSGFAAPVIHFAHGIQTPGFGWGDKDLTERSSPYFLGGYYPPDGPAIFMKAARLKPKYESPYFDPTLRVPLYEAVFHDSLIATHQWGFASLKFKEAQTSVSLFEALYQVPPLYHLNLEEFARQKARMRATYTFLSPLLRRTALMSLSRFTWLTPDKLVQQSVFGEEIRLTVNFGETPYQEGKTALPPHAALAQDLKTGQSWLYQP